ncbi:NUDIX domain-containing protein [Pseudomonas sp. Y24-6]|uniref:NUDIX domain-containing protein n=1 Tax=Pseudomonas sp. Y24-6 TaxID=2750013 RepID=UPI00298D2D5D|nr:NUDIX domain-containing protein [Pseudomonas sp. Y24-6]
MMLLEIPSSALRSLLQIDICFIADKDITLSPNKACPVILSGIPGAHILLFRHPIAGVQLVKGTIEKDETPAQAALRELSEESGIAAASVVSDMGSWDAGHR